MLDFKVISNKAGVDTILTQQTLCDLNFNEEGENFGNRLLCIVPETVSKTCCRLHRWQKLRWLGCGVTDSLEICNKKQGKFLLAAFFKSLKFIEDKNVSC